MCEGEEERRGVSLRGEDWSEGGRGEVEVE